MNNRNSDLIRHFFRDAMRIERVPWRPQPTARALSGGGLTTRDGVRQRTPGAITAGAGSNGPR